MKKGKNTVTVYEHCKSVVRENIMRELESPEFKDAGMSFDAKSFDELIRREVMDASKISIYAPPAKIRATRKDKGAKKPPIGTIVGSEND